MFPTVGGWIILSKATIRKGRYSSSLIHEGGTYSTYTPVHGDCVVRVSV